MKPLLVVLALIPLGLFGQSDFQEKYYPLNQDVVQEYAFKKERVYQFPNGNKEMTFSGETSETILDNTHDEVDQDGAFMVQQNIKQVTDATGAESHDTLNGIYTLEDGKLFLHAFVSSGNTLTEEEIMSPPSMTLDFNKMAAGEPFTSSVNLGGMKLVATVTNYEYVNLETPGGDFSNVLQVTMAGTISGELPAPDGNVMTIQEGGVNDVSYFAPDIGLIRQEQTMEMTIQVNEQITFKSFERKTKTLTAIREK